MENNNTVIIGYSGHAFVILDILNSLKSNVLGYCDVEPKENNPYKLNYLGKETENVALDLIRKNTFFACIGDNTIRAKIQNTLASQGLPTINVIHNQAICSPSVHLNHEKGILIAGNATLNAFAKIGKGTICNTACVIEHECEVGDYVHIAPGAVLCGNVKVGNFCFIGANAVIKQGITIGTNVTVGAGAVIVDDIPDNSIIIGNPAKIIKTKEL